MGSLVFWQPVCSWLGLGPSHLVVWPELPQHWRLQATGCWVGPGLGANELQQAQCTWPKTTQVSKLGLKPGLMDSKASALFYSVNLGSLFSCQMGHCSGGTN